MSFLALASLMTLAFVVGAASGWFAARKRFADDPECPMCGAPNEPPQADLDVTPVDLPRPRRDKLH